jgi:hypothetical protein
MNEQLQIIKLIDQTHFGVNPSTLQLVWIVCAGLVCAFASKCLFVPSHYCTLFVA